MKKCSSFAGPLANSSIFELRVSLHFADYTRTPEDPAVFGGSATHLPEGTVVELPEEGGYIVVEKPKD